MTVFSQVFVVLLFGNTSLHMKMQSGQCWLGRDQVQEGRVQTTKVGGTECTLKDELTEIDFFEDPVALANF